MCVIFVCARYLFHSQPSAPACNLYDSPLPRTRWRVNSHLPSPPRCHSVLLSPFSLIALDASHYDHNLGHIFIFWGSCYRNFLEKTTCSSKAPTKSSEEQELSKSNHLFSSAAFNLKCSHYEYLYCVSEVYIWGKKSNFKFYSMRFIHFSFLMRCVISCKFAFKIH